jgi:hypothetical protein
MKRILLLSFFTLILGSSFAQTGCYADWKKAFDERGAYAIGDEVHRNVYISFIEDGDSYCVAGKARVEYGKIVSIWLNVRRRNLRFDGSRINFPIKPKEHLQL